MKYIVESDWGPNEISVGGTLVAIFKEPTITDFQEENHICKFHSFQKQCVMGLRGMCKMLPCTPDLSLRK